MKITIEKNCIKESNKYIHKWINNAIYKCVLIRQEIGEPMNIIMYE